MLEVFRTSRIIFWHGRPVIWHAETLCWVCFSPKMIWKMTSVFVKTIIQMKRTMQMAALDFRRTDVNLFGGPLDRIPQETLWISEGTRTNMHAGCWQNRKQFCRKGPGGPGGQHVVSQWCVLVVKKINSVLRCINSNVVSKLGESPFIQHHQDRFWNCVSSLGLCSTRKTGTSWSDSSRSNLSV